MSVFDYELESFDGARPTELEWVHHYTRAKLKNVQTRARNLSAQFPTTYFRIIRPQDYKKDPDSAGFWYAGAPSKSPFMAALFAAEKLAFTSGKRKPLIVSQWDYTANAWVEKEQYSWRKERIFYGNLATIEALKKTLYPGVWRICAPDGEPLRYVRGGQYIDAAELTEYQRGRSQAEDERVAWIVPPGQKLDGYIFTGTTHRSDLGGFKDVFNAIMLELEDILRQGNLTPAQHKKLKAVWLATMDTAGLLD